MLIVLFYCCLLSIRYIWRLKTVVDVEHLYTLYFSNIIWYLIISVYILFCLVYSIPFSLLCHIHFCCRCGNQYHHTFLYWFFFFVSLGTNLKRIKSGNNGKNVMRSNYVKINDIFFILSPNLAITQTNHWKYV